MANGNHVNHVGGSGNGGFHVYRRFPQLTPAPSTAAEMSMGLPDLNQPIAANEEDYEFVIRQQDRFIPVSNVIRIMRRVLPPYAKISDESKATIQECVSQFISFFTGKANERCQREQRKTITVEDVLWAMKKYGFDHYIEPLTSYLHLYREFDAGSLRREPLLLKRPMIEPASGYSITPHHLPPNYPMTHHYDYFMYPPPMSSGYMQGDESHGSSSQCAVTIVDSDDESPMDEGKH